jgi:hypothetical protein
MIDRYPQARFSGRQNDVGTCAPTDLSPAKAGSRLTGIPEIPQLKPGATVLSPSSTAVATAMALAVAVAVAMTTATIPKCRVS